MIEGCKQANVLANFKVLKNKLEECALDNCDDNEEPDLSDDDTESLENTRGIGKGYYPTEFDNIIVRRLENEAPNANGEECYLQVYVDPIGTVSNACATYSENKEYVLVRFNDHCAHTSHCMYVVWLMRGNMGYFLCRDSKEFGERDGERYKTVFLNELKHEIYQVTVVVKRRIGSRQKYQAQNANLQNQIKTI